MRARQYDPSTGRFLSPDPVAATAGDPYVASYVYVGDNPELRTDPSGRCFGPLIFLLPACIGALIGAGSYVFGVAVSNGVQGRGVSFQGLNPVDLGISTAAVALTNGVAPELTMGGRVAFAAFGGFDATIWSMNAGHRHDPAELIAGTAVGGAGGALGSGSGFTGLLRGIVSGGLFNGAQTVVQDFLNGLFGRNAAHTRLGNPPSK
jgi:hypothetical protein